jgi:hypothetical protein
MFLADPSYPDIAMYHRAVLPPPSAPVGRGADGDVAMA